MDWKGTSVIACDLLVLAAALSGAAPKDMSVYGRAPVGAFGDVRKNARAFDPAMRAIGRHMERSKSVTTLRPP